MTSQEDGDSVQHPPTFASVPALHVAKTRSPTRDESPEIASSTYSSRYASPSRLTSRASTLVGGLSRSASPNGRLSLSLPRLGRSAVASPLGHPTEGNDEIRSLIVRSFSPVIGVYASHDTDALAKHKGFQNGFAEMIRPYGETITGKVVVRDSVGASRAWDDFGIYLLDLGQIAQQATRSPDNQAFGHFEEVLEQYVQRSLSRVGLDATEDDPASAADETSPYYRLFLSRLLSVKYPSPHEAFVHPIACVIAISSSTPSPIETLRQLYSQTAQGNRALPLYANPEYLRYYVLVHDDTRDDIAKSSTLFDQMKRHFGLHCHLLRIRSEPCRAQDEGAVAVPACEWLAPTEDLAQLESNNDLLDVGSKQTYLQGSDVQAIKAFVRELVAQSVVPHMENRIALWNEQVASRRRGISGRFMSLSKRWAAFGSGTSTPRSATQSPVLGAGASGNYDTLNMTYRYDTPEALLRKLADYAFMLRDYKLAASIYELLRTDYGNDKAWKYLAGANEMCAVANLLSPMAPAAKFRAETFDQMLETATYSYLTRCSDPHDTLRSMVLGLEMLKVRGKSASEIAAKWAIKILETNLVGSVGRVLVSERIASCFANQAGPSGARWGSRRRKAGMWSVMAADEWLKLGKADFAEQRLEDADALYEGASSEKALVGATGFTDMTGFMDQLRSMVQVKLGEARRRGASEAERLRMDEQERQQMLEETTERLEQLDTRPHRRSLIGGVAAVDLTPLSPVRTRRDSLIREDDDFE